MDNSQPIQPENGKSRQQPAVGVAYPVETVDYSIEIAKQLVSEHGTGKPISREEIAKTLNKSINTLSQFYSTLVQYGIFNVAFEKGYTPSDLYRKYMNPVHDGDEEKCKLEMLKKAPLYTRLFDNLTGHQLPTEIRRFANLLKEEPYNVSEYGAERAAKVFLDNARSLRLLDAHNTLRASNLESIASKPKKKENNQDAQQSTCKKDEPELFELPIPLPNRRKAYLRYPIDDLTKRDIQVIKKAIEFIASSIGEDEEYHSDDDLRDQHLGR